MIIHWNTRTNPQIVLAEGIWSFHTHVTDPTDTIVQEPKTGGMLASQHVRRAMRRGRRGRR